MKDTTAKCILNFTLGLTLLISVWMINVAKSAELKLTENTSSYKTQSVVSGLYERGITVVPEEIVTGVCTFGDCPVATTEPTTEQKTEAAKESSTTELVSDPYTFDSEPVTEWDGFDDEVVVAKNATTVYSAAYFRQMGEIYWGGWRWTWYSERVLPGSGLHIPGRHTDGDGYVRDVDGYICVATDALDHGTVIETPFGGYGKVYDCGCGYETIDVYVGW